MFDIVKEATGLVSHGVSACAGCGLELIIRNVLGVLGEDTTIVIPPGCSALFCGYGPNAGMRVSGLQGNLENTAAYAAGIKAGYEMQGNRHTTVLGFAGDGATVDIGIQSLSGVMERRDKVMYICYDNEAYMNTGIQGSSSSPMGAWTTTTPGGKPTRRKDLLRIAIAHDIPYCASASLANIPDLRRKVQKAKDTDGPSLLHIHCPCPTGWRYHPSKTIEVAKSAVQSGAWLLYEYCDGNITVNTKFKELKPIDGYFNLQGRFKDISDESMAEIKRQIKKQYEALRALASV
jgi:pyruvate/2-oxoacid:ferredoxin oxidoreductase beta subunit